MQKSPWLGLVFLVYGLGCLGLVLFLSHYSLVDKPPVVSKPNFTEIEDSQQRKQAFFDFLTPLIEHQNQRVLAVRDRLQSIQEEFNQNGEFSQRSIRYIESLTRTYRFDDEELSTTEQLERLFRRVDTIPLAMALAQAASESGWGRSRFARIANNFFGQWCYRDGCGIIPNRRPDGAVHEVAKFNNVRASVRSYFLNINTHYAYKDFRVRRQELRQSEEKITSRKLIPTLIQYSERGQDYLDDLYQIIRINNLSSLEQS